MLADPSKKCPTITALFDRYVAVRRPVRYHNRTVGQNAWRRAGSLALPPALLAALLAAPIAFELRLESARPLPSLGAAISVSRRS